MEYKSGILFLLILNVVWSRNCGTEDLNKLFNNGFDQCNRDEKWSFTSGSVTANNDSDVTNYLTPSSGRSCITSHPLLLFGGGKIQVKVYVESITKGDYVTVSVHGAMSNNVVAEATFSADDRDIVNGINTLGIEFKAVKTPVGYIKLVGAASENSVVLVESVCYLSPLYINGGVTKLTTNERAPDIFVMQTDSVLERQVHPVDVTEHSVEEGDKSGEVTVNRAMRFIDFDDFWTPLTISLVVIIPVIILVLLGWGCYALGKKRGSKQEPEIVYEDVNQIPKPYLVPRVKSVYAESVAGSAYGGRNNNVYSV